MVSNITLIAISWGKTGRNIYMSFTFRCMYAKVLMYAPFLMCVYVCGEGGHMQVCVRLCVYVGEFVCVLFCGGVCNTY